MCFYSDWEQIDIIMEMSDYLLSEMIIYPAPPPSKKEVFWHILLKHGGMVKGNVL